MDHNDFIERSGNLSLCLENLVGAGEAHYASLNRAMMCVFKGIVWELTFQPSGR